MGLLNSQSRRPFDQRTCEGLIANTYSQRRVMKSRPMPLVKASSGVRWVSFKERQWPRSCWPWWTGWELRPEQWPRHWCFLAGEHGGSVVISRRHILTEPKEILHHVNHVSSIPIISWLTVKSGPVLASQWQCPWCMCHTETNRHPPVCIHSFVKVTLDKHVASFGNAPGVHTVAHQNGFERFTKSCVKRIVSCVVLLVRTMCGTQQPQRVRIQVDHRFELRVCHHHQHVPVWGQQWWIRESWHILALAHDWIHSLGQHSYDIIIKKHAHLCSTSM